MRGVKFFFVGTIAIGLALSACTLLGPDDKAIVADIQSKLYQDPMLKTRNIQVVSAKGVVILSGEVGSDAEKSSAENIANHASGVKQVVDQLTVPQATAAPAAAMTEETNPAPAPEARRARTREAPATRMRRQHATAAAPPASAGGESEAAAAPAPAQPAPRAAETTPTPPPPPPRPTPVTIAAGTVITVQMIDPIDSARNHPGEEFTATLFSPIVVGDKVVAPRGANARVRLVQSASAGHMTGRSELVVQLVSVDINGQSYPVESSAYNQAGASRGKRTAETVGGGAVVGALLGGLLGHGKGAAIGAGVGAGGGAIAQEATKGQQVKIPSEAKIDFTLKTPITVTY